MGHVATGKTSLLDRIRRSDVQGGEAGGITQQIGATFFPLDILKGQTKVLNESFGLEYKIPGLLVIDTPGHESFGNLRNRGSTLCDIAILVVDLMHGLEAQTIESLKMLRKKKTPFIVALNKVDRIYGWEAHKNTPIRDTLATQNEMAMREFESRTRETITAFNEQGLNAALYWENPDYKSYVSLVPTSAHTGEGIPDLLLLLTQLTQSRMLDRLMWYNFVQSTVLEVKVIEGLGTTVDVILLNGTLKKGDTIVLAGLNGPIVSQVRALLTPNHGKEMRVARDFVHYDEVNEAMGVKIAAMGVESAIAGTPLLVCDSADNLEDLKEEVMEDLSQIEQSLKKEGRGVFVQASTLGSLEALLEFLRTLDPPIPVSGFNIGPIHKRDVMQASIMLEHKEEYATILAFDVPVTRDAKNLAEELGVRIFTAEIIYHLFDQFTKYLEDLALARKQAAAGDASKNNILWNCCVI
jgi:translation initiation factor 5B